MFDKMKELMEMKRKMEELKRELDSLELVTEDPMVKVTITAAQEVRKVELKGEPASMDKAKLEASVADTVNRAIKQSQKTAAERMHKLGGAGSPRRPGLNPFIAAKKKTPGFKAGGFSFLRQADQRLTTCLIATRRIWSCRSSALSASSTRPTPGA